MLFSLRMKYGMTLFWAGVAFIIIAGLGLTFFVKPGPGQLDSFAQCLGEKGAIFYGAYWCPHCQAQKRMFGKSAELLPYEECSTPNGQAQLQICIDKKIEQYPTWDFADGSRLTGEIPLTQLAEKTGCTLPSSEEAPEETPAE